MALTQGELTRLDLEGCQILCVGAEIVADFLKHNETVIEAELYGCAIGARGAKTIAEALKHNETVELLELRSNPIGDEGGEALLDALAYNVCIGDIPLYNTNVVSESVAIIIYLTGTRNAILIPAVVRRASLFLIAARRTIAGAGHLSRFPKEIVKMIAMEVWASRKEPIWINALTESERTGKSEK